MANAIDIEHSTMAERNERVRSPSEDRNNAPETMRLEAAELLLKMEQQRENSSRVHSVEYRNMLHDVLRQVEMAILHQKSENSDLRSGSLYETSEKVTRTETSEAVHATRDTSTSHTGNIARFVIILLLSTLIAISSGIIPFTGTRTESYRQLQKEIFELRQRVQELEQNTIKAFEKSARAIERVASRSQNSCPQEDPRSQPVVSAKSSQRDNDIEPDSEEEIWFNKHPYLYIFGISLFFYSFLFLCAWLDTRV